MKTFRVRYYEQCMYVYYYFKKKSLGDFISYQIRLYKDGHKRQVKLFSKIAAEKIAAENLEIDFIVRVLSSKETSALQGNKLRSLALNIMEYTNAHYNPQILQKNRKTRSFSSNYFAQKERADEINGVYQLNDEGINFNGKNILVIDDIATTGTTLEAIGKVFKEKYPKVKLYAFCLAHTVSPEYDGVSSNEPDLETEYKSRLSS